MNKTLTIPTLATLCAIGAAVAWADDDAVAPPIPLPVPVDEPVADPEATETEQLKEPHADVDLKTKNGKTSIVVRSFGKVVHIGPDGLVEVKEFNSDSDDPEVQRLRLNLRDFLKNKRAEAWSNEDKGGEDSADQRDGDDDAPNRRRGPLFGLGRLLRLGEDGIIKELDHLPEDIDAILDGIDVAGGTTVRGQVEIVGPDGKEQKIDINNTIDLEVIKKRMQEAIGESGVQVELNVLREIDEAMRRLRDSGPLRAPAWRQRFDTSDDDDVAEERLESISDKLDQILNRIEKLEVDVAGLKNKTEI